MIKFLVGFLSGAAVLFAIVVLEGAKATESSQAVSPEATANAWIRDEVEDIGLERTRLISSRESGQETILTMLVWLENGVRMKSEVTLVDGLHVKKWRAIR